MIRSALRLLMLYLCSSIPAFAVTPLAGHWWNPNESGTGYNLDYFNGVLVVTIFSYKTTGDSEWYLAAGPMNANGHQFSATLNKYRNGQCISCSYQAPTAGGNDGVISMDFQSETSATLSLPNGRVATIEPLFPTTNYNLQGTYRLTRVTVSYAGGPTLDTAQGNVVASGNMAVSNGFVTQTLTASVNGSSATVTLAGAFSDDGAYMTVNENGVQQLVTLVTRRGPFLATLVTVPAAGNAPAFSEVDQWELISTVASSSDVKASNMQRGGLGAAIGAVLFQ